MLSLIRWKKITLITSDRWCTTWNSLVVILHGSKTLWLIAQNLMMRSACVRISKSCKGRKQLLRLSLLRHSKCLRFWLIKTKIISKWSNWKSHRSDQLSKSTTGRLRSCMQKLMVRKLLLKTCKDEDLSLKTD